MFFLLGSKLQIPFLFVLFQIMCGWVSFPAILLPCPAVQTTSWLLPIALVANCAMIFFLMKTYFSEPGFVKRDEGPYHR